MDGKSLDILSDKLNMLKEIVPEAFTEDKVDWEKIKAAFGEDINFENERYNLNWAGKSDAFRVLQQRTPATLIPVKDESVNFDETENAFIEGENLEVLKVLQKSYFGKIKMIYIDPPYNTGNDSFIYPDKFSESKDEYLKRIGDKSEEGYLLKEGYFRKNSKDSGHYHSNWLTMMYPRLYIARNLLRDDGVIFISIDDNEVHNLRMIMNEIFGEENFIASIIWQKKYSPQNDATYFSEMHDYILVFAKQAKAQKNDNEGWNRNLFPRTVEMDSRYKNPDNDNRGDWKPSGLDAKTFQKDYDFPITTPSGRVVNPPRGKSWRYSKKRFEELVIDNRIWFGENGNNVPSIKRFLNEVQQGTVPSTWWDREEFGDNQEGTKEFNDLFNDSKVIFDNPKPTRLLKKVLQLSTNNNDDYIVLDFFAGSGTTAQAVLELNKEDGGNRKFILVQLPEKTDENSEAFKAGYKTIADICKERISKVIQKINDELDATRKELNSIEKQTIKKESELSKLKKNKPELFENQKPSKEIQKIIDEIVRLNQNQNEKSEQLAKLTNCDKGFKYFSLSLSNFKHWRSDIIESEEDLNKMVELFDTQLKPKAKELNMLYELMLKSGYTLTDRIEQKEGFYLIADKLAVVLNKIDQTIIDKILKTKSQTCIILDKLFAENDQLKTNTSLQFKDSGIEFVNI